jgi:hypothetical protein
MRLPSSLSGPNSLVMRDKTEKRGDVQLVEVGMCIDRDEAWQ